MVREAGSILLETLIAFAIAAMALVALLSGALSGLRATRVAGGYDEALARARSHLAVFDERVRPLLPGSAEGDDGSGYRWHTTVTPMAATVVNSGDVTLPGGTGAVRETLYQVSATIQWKEDGKPRQVTLSTLRLGRGSGR